MNAIRVTLAWRSRRMARIRPDNPFRRRNSNAARVGADRLAAQA
ncbi:MAG TPA: hypothetical protein P5081_12975 [Phycisphaerae bacterium]|nr:hypothetical protein [Phycisphaerae bacterium]HRW53789.1 hypothetical protein [Phycisphaerae bacterium]